MKLTVHNRKVVIFGAKATTLIAKVVIAHMRIADASVLIIVADVDNVAVITIFVITRV